MQGAWGEKQDTTWDFFLADELPDDINISAVMGLPFWDDKIILAQTRRGWEIPGGHVEAGEDATACLRRELMEEVGASSLSTIKLFGYRKITNPDGKEKYPRNTVMPYYLVELGAAPTGAQAEDSIAFGSFKSTDALVVNSHDYQLILIALTAKIFLDKRL